MAVAIIIISLTSGEVSPVCGKVSITLSYVYAMLAGE